MENLGLSREGSWANLVGVWSVNSLLFAVIFGVGPEVCGEVELIELQTRTTRTATSTTNALAYFDALSHAPKLFTSD